MKVQTYMWYLVTLDHIQRQSGRYITLAIIQDATNILEKYHKDDLFIKLCIEIWLIVHVIIFSK
jgi:hypothetical protein